MVDDFAQFKELYGLENDPSLLEPRWSDTLIDALASPGVAVLLLIIGGVALYVELHTPGARRGGLRGPGLLRAVLLEPVPGRDGRLAGK